jgi:hypothetical protein
MKGKTLKQADTHPRRKERDMLQCFVYAIANSLCNNGSYINIST